MSVTSISANNKYLLWSIAGGRCQYKGCNHILYQDILTKKNFNGAYVAHIVADQPGGPRGDKIRSRALADKIENLMLLCDKHHRLIDKVDVAGHPEKMLVEMKMKHETRIRRVTGIAENKQSYIVTYRASVGKSVARDLSYQNVSQSLIPDFYPALPETIDLSMDNPMQDHERKFWEFESMSLERNVLKKLEGHLAKGVSNHFSIFAFAPIPLLMKLGTLINSNHLAEVYQPKRNTSNFKLIRGKHLNVSYQLNMPKRKSLKPVLCISLSGKINHDRIINVLGKNCSIYEITVANPNPNYLKSRKDLEEFELKSRAILDHIRSDFGDKIELNIFPAMPISTAITFGRLWLPKADMPLVIYDQNTRNGGFKRAMKINNK